MRPRARRLERCTLIPTRRVDRRRRQPREGPQGDRRSRCPGPGVRGRRRWSSEWPRSLALLADAGHMVSDAVALGGALFASRLALRPARGSRSSAGAAPESLPRWGTIRSSSCLGHGLRAARQAHHAGRRPRRGHAGRRARRDRRERGGDAGALARVAGESERARRVPARLHRPGRVRRDGGRGRADPRDRLGPLRPDREPPRRRADAVLELGPAPRVGAASSSRLADGIDPEAVARALVADPTSSRCTTCTSGR